MQPKLTANTSASKAAIEQTKLTGQDSAYFKLIFSRQIQRKYRFNSLHSPPSGRRFSNGEYARVLKSLGIFIDRTIGLTITEVEDKYLRKPYRSDTVIDPETQQKVKVQHLCLFDKQAGTGAPVIMPSDSIRLHGYYRGEYFVLIRLDWFHKFRTESL